MSVAAVMMVRDEEDIIEATLTRLRGQVDRVFVADNRSRDGTRDILERLAYGTSEAWLDIEDDAEVGYFQADKMTRLARKAGAYGYTWVVPVDADEAWTAADGRRLGDFLDGVAPDAQVVRARLYDYIPTALDDPAEPDPIRRLQWRLPQPGVLPKVAARARADLSFHPGNHGADYGAFPHLAVDGLIVRHYTWRSEDQYVRKIRNGVEAYAATDYPAGIGQHWRMWADLPDDAIRDHYRQWFYREDPEAAGLVHDPAGG